MYAGELACFLAGALAQEKGATHLSSFVLALRTTRTARPGRGQGRPPGSARINHVLAVARQPYKHAATVKGDRIRPRATPRSLATSARKFRENPWGQECLGLVRSGPLCPQTGAQTGSALKGFFASQSTWHAAPTALSWERWYPKAPCLLSL
jgi:hypothetical protein